MGLGFFELGNTHANARAGKLNWVLDAVNWSREWGTLMKGRGGTNDAGVIDGKPCHWSSVRKKCTNNYMWRRIDKACKPCHWSNVRKKCTNNYKWRCIDKACHYPNMSIDKACHYQNMCAKTKHLCKLTDACKDPALYMLTSVHGKDKPCSYRAISGQTFLHIEFLAQFPFRELQLFLWCILRMSDLFQAWPWLKHKTHKPPGTIYKQ